MQSVLIISEHLPRILQGKPLLHFALHLYNSFFSLERHFSGTRMVMSISHKGTNVGMKYILTLANIIYGYLDNDNNKDNTENIL